MLLSFRLFLGVLGFICLSPELDSSRYDYPRLIFNFKQLQLSVLSHFSAQSITFNQLSVIDWLDSVIESAITYSVFYLHTVALYSLLQAAQGRNYSNNMWRHYDNPWRILVPCFYISKYCMFLYFQIQHVKWLYTWEMFWKINIHVYIMFLYFQIIVLILYCVCLLPTCVYQLHSFNNTQSV